MLKFFLIGLGLFGVSWICLFFLFQVIVQLRDKVSALNALLQDLRYGLEQLTRDINKDLKNIESEHEFIRGDLYEVHDSVDGLFGLIKNEMDSQKEKIKGFIEDQNIEVKGFIDRRLEEQNFRAKDSADRTKNHFQNINRAFASRGPTVEEDS